MNCNLSLQWDDSIDSLSEGSPGRGSIHLPTPKRRLVSPLKKYEIKKIGVRRKHKKWSTLEEDTLRTGVQKYVILLYVGQAILELVFYPVCLIIFIRVFTSVKVCIIFVLVVFK